ncbi:MAG: dTDP-4-dehydrorhamnose 3,5-epimerase [Simkaniaceae bacterium]|nr:dTDP-4-dehydrorhamnose 3,5-epimerase [Candidatus Sacchlamyda saccharinae]
MIVEDKLSGVKLIRRKAFGDERGFFSELYRKSLYEEMGIMDDFVQDNHSFSSYGTIRGMHFQSFPGQAKLVSVVVGTIYDVYVDIRKDSPTFGQWGARELAAEKHEQLYVPNGFAHGFAVLSETAHVIYKVSSDYNPETEKSFRFDDPEVGIEWPIDHPILSERDKTAPLFSEVLK